MKKLLNKITKYHFEAWHLILLILIIVTFHTILTFIHNNSTKVVISRSIEIFRKEMVERIADLTTTSLEMLVEQVRSNPPEREEEKLKVIEKLNIILNQQLLQKSVKKICIVAERGNTIYFIKDGRSLYDFLFGAPDEIKISEIDNDAFKMYITLRDSVYDFEKIYSHLKEGNIVEVVVPFIPWGEFHGLVYMKVVPDISNIIRVISSSYSEIGAVFSVLILFGLLGMFFISNYVLRERDDALRELYKEKEIQIRKEVERRKEINFANRIYHAHHKAEKIMGFVNEDLSSLSKDNIEEVKIRVIKYAKFISRVIYDMKIIEPPIHVVRSNIFKTNVNEVIRFLINNLFLRVYKKSDEYDFELNLDDVFPVLNVNEYILWEIIEPLIQNKIDHNNREGLVIFIKTEYDEKALEGRIFIEDNGEKFKEKLLEFNQFGYQRIFEENVSTKGDRNSGFGCYIAYENCKRCGWKIFAENPVNSGARFKIIIPIS